MDGRGILEFMLASLNCPAPISILSLRGPGLSNYKRFRRLSLQMGWMGWDGMGGNLKVSFNFLRTLYVYRTCIYETVRHEPVRRAELVSLALNRFSLVFLEKFPKIAENIDYFLKN